MSWCCWRYVSRLRWPDRRQRSRTGSTKQRTGLSPPAPANRIDCPLDCVPFLFPGPREETGNSVSILLCLTMLRDHRLHNCIGICRGTLISLQCMFMFAIVLFDPNDGLSSKSEKSGPRRMDLRGVEAAMSPGRSAMGYRSSVEAGLAGDWSAAGVRGCPWQGPACLSGGRRCGWD